MDVDVGPGVNVTVGLGSGAGVMVGEGEVTEVSVGGGSVGGGSVGSERVGIRVGSMKPAGKSPVISNALNTTPKARSSKAAAVHSLRVIFAYFNPIVDMAQLCQTVVFCFESSHRHLRLWDWQV